MTTDTELRALAERFQHYRNSLAAKTPDELIAMADQLADAYLEAAHWRDEWHELEIKMEARAHEAETTLSSLAKEKTELDEELRDVRKIAVELDAALVKCSGEKAALNKAARLEQMDRISTQARLAEEKAAWAKEKAELLNALKVLLKEAESFNVSGVYFDEPCMQHKGPELARAAIAHASRLQAAQPGIGA